MKYDDLYNVYYEWRKEEIKVGCGIVVVVGCVGENVVLVKEELKGF